MQEEIKYIRISASKVASYIGFNPFNLPPSAISEFFAPFYGSPIGREFSKTSSEEIKEIGIKLGLKNAPEHKIRTVLEKKLDIPSTRNVADTESKNVTNKLISNLNLKGDIKKSAESYVAMKRGENFERKDIDSIQKSRGTNISQRNDNFYELDFDLGNYMGDKYECIVTGKIDGFEEETGKLIESKHRRNRLFNSVPLYEKVQCEIYMRMLNIHECLHCETYETNSVECLLKADDSLYMDIQKRLKEVFLPIWYKKLEEINNKNITY